MPDRDMDIQRVKKGVTTAWWRTPISIDVVYLPNNKIHLTNLPSRSNTDALCVHSARCMALVPRVIMFIRALNRNIHYVNQEANPQRHFKCGTALLSLPVPVPYCFHLVAANLWNNFFCFENSAFLLWAIVQTIYPQRNGPRHRGNEYITPDFKSHIDFPNL